MTDVAVRNLSVWLGNRSRQRLIIDDVDLDISAGTTMGLVGESGSGKSTMARAILRALPPGKITGTVTFEGVDVYQLDPDQLRKYHTTDVALIGQNPRAAMNPVRRVGDFATETLRTNRGMSPAEARSQLAQLLSEVGIRDPERVLDQYPHQLSGGMLQRVVIAAALSTEPKLMIADEPTTALDVTTQAEVMAILGQQARSRGMSMLFITHDLDLVSAVCDRIAVMYAGRIVDEQASSRLLSHPQHPYTQALASARTRVDVDVPRLEAIPGNPIAAYEAPPGCSFALRCPYVTDACLTTQPLVEATPAGRVACIRHTELGDLSPILAEQNSRIS
jgi:oligopeptide/dipeptide ABC transporter ATP-binding protein